MNKTIMIIEDDFETQLLFSELLRAEGYEVLPMSSGVEAVSSLESGSLPHLIFMDLNFPGGSPEEFTNKLHSRSETRDIPVIIVSGKDNIAEYATLLKASSFVKKPFEIDHLIGLIQNFI